MACGGVRVGHGDDLEKTIDGTNKSSRQEAPLNSPKIDIIFEPSASTIHLPARDLVVGPETEVKGSATVPPACSSTLESPPTIIVDDIPAKGYHSKILQ